MTAASPSRRSLGCALPSARRGTGDDGARHGAAGATGRRFAGGALPGAAAAADPLEPVAGLVLARAAAGRGRAGLGGPARPVDRHARRRPRDIGGSGGGRGSGRHRDVAVPAGLALGRRRFRGKGLLELCLLAPAALPAIAVAMGLHAIFLRLGLAGSATGRRARHLAPTLPYAILTVTAAAAADDGRRERVARTLGAGPGRTFLLVTLPA